MNNKYKKGAFFIVLGLFIIFLPLTIAAVYFKVNADNPNKMFHYGDKLYFYNGKDLLGTYKCQYENCSYAREVIKDDDYFIDYNKTGGQTGIINNKYAFISDYKDSQNIVYLYDIENGSSAITYKSYKYYGIGIKDDHFIVEAPNGKYGVIQVKNKVKIVLPYEYDYIAAANVLDGNKLSDKFIALKNGKWALLDNNGNELTSEFNNPIVSYDDSVVVIKNNAYYSLYSYTGTIKPAANAYSFKNLRFISKYLEITDLSDKYYIYDPQSSTKKSDMYNVYGDTTVETKLSGNVIEVIINGNFKESVEIK